MAYGPAQIREELERLVNKGEIELAPQRGTPDIRTISDIIENDLEADESQPWVFALTTVDHTDPVDARNVLEVYAYLTETPSRRIGFLTREQAEWIIRIRSAYPEMPAWAVWKWTVRYIEFGEEAYRHLDAQLAFEIWRSHEDPESGHFERYQESLQLGPRREREQANETLESLYPTFIVRRQEQQRRKDESNGA